jgi:NAD-dependent deacetylase
LESCDLFFSIGTSAVVEPAASFLHTARRRGAKTAEINREPTPVSRMADWSLQGSAGEILPGLVQRVFGI